MSPAQGHVACRNLPLTGLQFNTETFILLTLLRKLNFCDTRLFAERLQPNNEARGEGGGAIYIYPMMLWCKFLSCWQNMAGHGVHERRFFFSGFEEPSLLLLRQSGKWNLLTLL